MSGRDFSKREPTSRDVNSQHLSSRDAQAPSLRRNAGMPLWIGLASLLVALALLLGLLVRRTQPASHTPTAAATNTVQQTGPLPRLVAVRFDPNKTELSNDAKEELDGIAETMRQDRHVHLRLEGYVDETTPAARRENLSHERAGNVADYLQRKGVETAQLTGEGFATADALASHADTDPQAGHATTDLETGHAEADSWASQASLHPQNSSRQSRTDHRRVEFFRAQ